MNPSPSPGGSLHSFAARLVFAWLFALLVLLFTKQMLFTGILHEPANGHLPVSPLLTRHGLALLADICLTIACLIAFFLPRLMLPVIVTAAGWVLLLLSFTTAWSDRLVWSACVAAALVFAVRRENFFRLALEGWRLLGIAALSFVIYKITVTLLRASWGSGAVITAGAAALLVALLLQRDKWRVFSLLTAAIAIAGMKLLFHLNSPLLLCTIIFAPFLNWPNLHRFFVRRFEPR
jgi:hypothetical protein